LHLEALTSLLSTAWEAPTSFQQAKVNLRELSNSRNLWEFKTGTCSSTIYTCCSFFSEPYFFSALVCPSIGTLKGANVPNLVFWISRCLCPKKNNWHVCIFPPFFGCNAQIYNREGPVGLRLVRNWSVLSLENFG